MTALVTGAASGMGRATSHVLAEAGARIAVTDVDEEGAQTVAAEIEEAVTYACPSDNFAAISLALGRFLKFSCPRYKSILFPVEHDRWW